MDLSGPATQPVGDPTAQLVFSGGRDIVSDVWVRAASCFQAGELTRSTGPLSPDATHAWAGE